MIKITYCALVAVISALWLVIRAVVCLKNKRFDIKRELQLLLVYICIVVVVRFTFFPFGTDNGRIQPLILDTQRILPFRMNLIPLVNLFDYPSGGAAVLNVIGNIAMFIPLGIVWPKAFKDLDSHTRVILAGVGASLCIEILQLPFFDRVSDLDDILLNSLGYIIGYLIYLAVKKLTAASERK